MDAPGKGGKRGQMQQQREWNNKREWACNTAVWQQNLAMLEKYLKNMLVLGYNRRLSFSKLLEHQSWRVFAK
jgi:hypothetical protein